MNQLDYKKFLIFIFPSILILTILFTFPLGQMLVNSVQAQGDFFSLKNYSVLVKMEEFWVSFKNLLLFTVVSVSGHIIIGLIIALLVNIPIKGQKLFRSISLLPWMLPPAVVATTWAWMYHTPFGIINPLLQSIGLINQPIAWLSTKETAMASLLITNLWRGYPFVSIILLAGLQAIPKQLYEAAEIDGAGSWQSFLFVTLPLLKKAILIAGLLDLMGTVKYFDMIWVMTRGGPAHATEVLATFIYKLFFMAMRPGVAAALGVVMLIALGIFTGIYLKLISDQNQ